MNRAISKKIMAIVAIVALVAILGVCLVACNKDDYVKRLEKADYHVEASNEYEGEDVEWAVVGKKGSLTTGLQTVTVVKFSKSDDAKKAYDDAKDNLPKGWDIKKSGSIIIVGTEQGVKDAQ